MLKIIIPVACKGAPFYCINSKINLWIAKYSFFFIVHGAQLNILHLHTSRTSMLTCSSCAASLAVQIATLHNDVHTVLPPWDEAHVVDEVLRGVLLEGGVEHQGGAVPQEQAVPLPVSRRGQPVHSQRPQPATTTGFQLRNFLGNCNTEIERVILKWGTTGKT